MNGSRWQFDATLSCSLSSSLRPEASSWDRCRCLLCVGRCFVCVGKVLHGIHGPMVFLELENTTPLSTVGTCKVTVEHILGHLAK